MGKTEGEGNRIRVFVKWAQLLHTQAAGTLGRVIAYTFKGKPQNIHE